MQEKHDLCKFFPAIVICFASCAPSSGTIDFPHLAQVFALSFFISDKFDMSLSIPTDDICGPSETVLKKYFIREKIKTVTLF